MTCLPNKLKTCSIIWYEANYSRGTRVCSINSVKDIQYTTPRKPTMTCWISPSTVWAKLPKYNLAAWMSGTVCRCIKNTLAHCVTVSRAGMRTAHALLQQRPYCRLEIWLTSLCLTGWGLAKRQHTRLKTTFENKAVSHLPTVCLLPPRSDKLRI